MADKDNDQRYYSAHRLNIVFAFCSLLFLVAMLGMFWQDFNREWRGHQKAFREIALNRAEADLNAAEARLLESPEYTNLTARLAGLEAAQEQRAAEVATLDAQIDAQSKRTNIALQQLNVARTELSAVKYQVENAHGQAPAELLKTFERRGQDVSTRTLAYEEAQTRLAGIVEAKRGLVASTEEARRELRRLSTEVSLLRRKVERLDRARMSTLTAIGDIVRDLPVLDMLNPRYNVRDHQIIVEGVSEDLIFAHVPRVDRCTVCHQGIDQRGFEDEMQPYRTHPNLDLFVGASSPHPIKEFGCTSCHEGRGRGTSFTSAAHMPDNAAGAAAWKDEHDWQRLHHWEDTMNPLKYAESGCFQCHSGATKIEGAPKFTLGLALVDQAGCYGCHEIEKYKDSPKAGPSLRSLAHKTTEDWAYRWIQNPSAFRAHTWMPHYFGQSNNADIADRTAQEVHGLVRYLFDESAPYTPASKLEEAIPGDAARGRELTQSLGCQACHMLEDETYTETLTMDALRRQFGPELSGLGSKTTAEWLYNWLKDPRAYHAGTRMPNLRLADDEARDITAYLMASRNEGFEGLDVPAPDAAVTATVAKDFLVASMTHAEADRRVAEMSLEQQQHFIGERLIAHYGCFGCHDIPGFENRRPIGTALTEIGSKATSKLDFGLKHEIPHLNYAWFENKLHNPRVFDDGMIKTPLERLKMPNFNFADNEIEALVTALLSFKTPSPALQREVERTPKNLFIESGEKMISQQNCRSCHVIDGEGGSFHPTVAAWLKTYGLPVDETAAEEAEEAVGDGWDEGEDDGWGDEAGDGAGEAVLLAGTYSPPTLNGEGAKVRPEWLYHFLDQPSTVRPWLQVRMPTYHFDNEELNRLVSYFNFKDDQPFPFTETVRVDTNSAAFVAAHEMFSPSVMNCARCHINAGQTPEGMSADNWAPDLAYARARLKPDWIIRWLGDPQSLVPGTRMPAFWPEGEPSPMPHLNGDPLEQRKAIRDYLFSLDAGN